jgi:hypothetical protein
MDDTQCDFHVHLDGPLNAFVTGRRIYFYDRACQKNNFSILSQDAR